jgi:hypothetical protein
VITAVEHVSVADEHTEYWTCGDTVLQDGPLGYEISIRGSHRLYLTRTTFEQLCDIVRARDDRKQAAADGWLVESKVAS